MKILLVNDDGIEAKGLRALASALAPRHEVVVCAPDDQRSCTSHAVTMHKELVLREAEGYPCRAFCLSGTPADCVKFGLLTVAKGADLVVSGINDTTNMGTDVQYSGTVGAAIEATVSGVKGIAVSIDVVDDDYEYIAAFVRDNLSVLADMCDVDRVISINCNSSKREDIKGIKVASVGVRRYDDYYEEVSPSHYLLKGTIVDVTTDEETDVKLAKQGYLCITPIKVRLTDIEGMESVERKVGQLCW